MPNSSFIIPARFHPARSLLGRWTRMYSVDARQAETTYLVVVVIASLALLLLHLFAWALIPATGPTIVLAATEFLLLVVCGAAAVVGREAAITIKAEPSALTISRTGDETLNVAYEAIDWASRIDAQTFHRHYRRYAETLVFVNRLPDELLLLRWNGIPVVLGLAEDDLSALLNILERRAPVVHASCHVGAA